MAFQFIIQIIKVEKPVKPETKIQKNARKNLSHLQKLSWVDQKLTCHMKKWSSSQAANIMHGTT